MRKQPTAKIRKAREIERRSQNALSYYPKILGQSAKESFTDYSNPRENKVAVRPGTPSKEYQKAVNYLSNLGGGTLFIRTGRHLLQDPINLKSGVNIIGEIRDASIIDFQDVSGCGVYSEGELLYDTGTISATDGSPTITGSGTTWDSSLEGAVIFFAGTYYIVDSVNSSNSITLESNFSGTSLSGEEYVIAEPTSNTEIHTLTIENAETGISHRYSIDSHVKNLYVYGGVDGLVCDWTVPITVRDVSFYGQSNDGFRLTKSSAVTFEGFLIGDSGGYGIYADELFSSVIFNGGVDNSTLENMYFENSSDISMTDLSVTNGSSHGIHLYENNDSIYMTKVTTTGNSGDGMRISSTTAKTIISNQVISGNSGFGINIVASSNTSTLVVGNQLEENTSGAVSDSGTGTKIKSNIGVGDTP